jgi:putative ABC transport system substrate-binding protein
MTARRTFIAVASVGLLAIREGVTAQAPTKVRRIGFLSAASRQAVADAGYYRAFLQGMRDLGYIEGANIGIEARFADDDYERLPALAAELVGLRVEVIVAVPSPAIRAAQHATNSIPIVFPSTGDPVGSGFAASLAHPGGNLTGLSNSNRDISAKLLELLLTIAPKISRVAVLANPGSSNARSTLKNIETAMPTPGIEVQIVMARTSDEIESGFAAMRQQHADALVIAGDSFLSSHGRQIADFAAQFRLPSIGTRPSYAKAGGLMSYGIDAIDSYRRAATYVDKILKGAKPGDLPIEQPTKFEMVINLKTAKTLGLTLPQSLLLRADEVVQ